MLDRLLVPTGGAAALRDRPTDDKLGLADKEEAADVLTDLRVQLFDLQSRLWAESQRAVLVVLQAMDAGGKEGTTQTCFLASNGVQHTPWMKIPAGSASGSRAIPRHGTGRRN